MIDLRSLKTLLWVKQRRLAPLEQQVQAEAAKVAAAADAHGAAIRHHETSLANEAGCAAKIEALATSERFRPDEIVTLGHVLQGLADVVRQAADAVTVAVRRHAEAQQQLALARQALQRAERQLEQLEERRTRRLQEIDQEGEDTQDEESEEAAVARKVAQRRAKLQESVH